MNGLAFFPSEMSYLPLEHPCHFIPQHVSQTLFSANTTSQHILLSLCLLWLSIKFLWIFLVSLEYLHVEGEGESLRQRRSRKEVSLIDSKFVSNKKRLSTPIFPDDSLESTINALSILETLHLHQKFLIPRDWNLRCFQHKGFWHNFKIHSR